MHVPPTNSSEQQQFDVVVIAEKFGGAHLPEGAVTWPLQKLGPFTLLELCLEWVSWFDSPNVIVATTGSLDEKDSQAVERRWNHSHAFDGKLRVLPFANCHSANDVLREVESRRLLSSGGNFILVDNVATLCSSNLERQLAEFTARLKQNKNNVLTILLTPTPTTTDSHRAEARTLVGYERATGRLISYGRVGEDDMEVSSRVPVPKERFISESCYRSDLRPCGIYFCAHSLLSHFSGNYDLQTLDGIVEDILHNEEFLAQNIHVEVIEALPTSTHAVTEAHREGTEQETAASVVLQQPSATTSTRIQCATNYAELLLELQQRLIERYSFPLTFDNVLPFFKDFDRLKCRAGANVYISASSVEDPFANRSNVANSVFGKGTEVHSSATVEGSVFGANAKIGKNSVVKKCLFGDFARVGDNCHLEDCIVGPKAVIGSGVHLTRMCLLPSGSRVLATDDPGKLPSLTDYSNQSCATAGGGIREGKAVRNKRNREEEDDGAASSDDDEGSEAVDGVVDVIYQGNTAYFLAEVTESMRSMVVSSSMENGVISANDGASVPPQLSSAQKERVEKMKLEINASKLAYNISIEELSRGIFLAFLRLPQVTGGSFAQLARAFKEWQPLWRNYYKKDANKTELLHAVEEFALANDAFKRMLPKFLHFLYDTEDFLPDDVILDWFNKLPADSPLLKITKLKELVDWIADDGDEEDEDEG